MYSRSEIFLLRVGVLLAFSCRLEAQSSVLYAGVGISESSTSGVGAGIYKSIDGGLSWTQTLAGDPFGAFFATSILVDQQNPANVYVAAFDVSSSSFVAGTSLFKSIDAGKTWSQITPSGLSYIEYLAIDATSRNTLYLGSVNDGFFKSTDSGRTWNRSGLARVTGLSADPNRSGVVYASVFQDIYKSTDSGTTWTLLAHALNDASLVNRIGVVKSVTVDPQNGSVLYAPVEGLCAEGGTDYPCGLFKSTDGGQRWTDLHLHGYFTNVAFDTRTGDIYAGGALSPFTGHAMKSSDGGTTWTAVNSGITANSLAVYTDPGVASTVYAISLDSQRLPGVFKTNNAGVSWTYMKLPAGGVSAFAVAQVGNSTGGPPPTVSNTPALTASPPALYFNYQVGGTAPSSVSVQITSRSIPK